MKKITIGIVILVLLGGGGWYFMNKNSGDTTTEDSSTSEVFIEEEPEPTEEPSFEKSDFSIKILNGSGTAGLAGKLQEDLESEDFNITDTGNADNYDYTTTIIQAKDSVPEGFVSQLEDAISSTYGDIDRESLGDDKDADVVIIIGGAQEKEQSSDTTDDTEDTTDSNNESTSEADIE